MKGKYNLTKIDRRNFEPLLTFILHEIQRFEELSFQSSISNRGFDVQMD